MPGPAWIVLPTSCEAANLVALEAAWRVPALRLQSWRAAAD